ncbi:uncharacterized protein LOC119787039 isoform X2 [Cyprinodon tularosa]|uniref:uncharacterized protein LOC119787039 isoform X2 n=1 Tax=Cyprinodon tularosa TaxID=77115 RepID=UPI0018E2265F|nr:uncharacterized protein LOC119787039 isoform X2 [Cyprinodon tularosa]
MLEDQWSEALAANNIRTIVYWLKKLTNKGDVGLEEHLQTFGYWLQRTSEITKKELVTLCFSRCQGLWMFLDRTSFIKVHILLQRLQNLLILVQWSRKHLGVKVPCLICRDQQHSTDGCCNQEHWTLKQHIWLGRLVQWWGIMGLLPRLPAQELRRISQMWKEMELSHREMCLKTTGWNNCEMERCGFLIEGIVMQLYKRHGCIWTSEDCTDQCYPPPTLLALLMLVMIPGIDNMSVQGILMYFILDMENFLQCKDNLLQSFCHAFSIPTSFSQQIKAFWMFDRGRIKASMGLLLSPKAAVPQFSWQHRYIITSLLKRKQNHMALKYLQWTQPPIETTEDAKLFAEVFLQSSCVSDAWSLLKRSHTESEDMIMYFIQACRDFNLGAEALKYIPEGYDGKEACGAAEVNIVHLKIKDCFGEMTPCPLSATLYQNETKRPMGSEKLFKLVQKAVTEVRKPHLSMRVFVWPKQPKRKSSSREIFLSAQALRRLTPSPFPLEALEETEQNANTEDYYALNFDQPETQEDILSSENQSSLSACSFSSASSAPLLNQPHEFESTITLQKISALLTDQEIHNKGDEEEEKFTTVADCFPPCSKLKLTPDGAIEQLSLGTFDKNKAIMYSLEGEVEDHKCMTEEAYAAAKTVSHKIEEQSQGFLPISGDQEAYEERETSGCGIQDLSRIPYTQNRVIGPNHSSASLTASPNLYNIGSPCIVGPSFTDSLAIFNDFSATQMDNIQAEGLEPGGWRGKAQQHGAMRSGRTLSRKGKHLKRT